MNGFDRLATLYDPLARMIYGQSIVQAQTCFLDVIPSFSKVLIVGGGTGWLLTKLLQDHPECEVWYIESSVNMLSMAARKSMDPGRVHFILGTEEDIPGCGFDVVITHFFLDLFSKPALLIAVQKICLALRPSALWIVADFVDQGKGWQRFLLKTMYSFFRQTCRIEARTLPPWGGALIQSGLYKVEHRLYYKGFIESAVYRMPSVQRPPSF